MACSASAIDSSGVAGNLRLASAIRNGSTSLPLEKSSPPEQRSRIEAILHVTHRGEVGVIILQMKQKHGKNETPHWTPPPRPPFTQSRRAGIKSFRAARIQRPIGKDRFSTGFRPLPPC